MSAATNPPGPPALVRLATAMGRLDERRAQLAQVRDLVEVIDPLWLVPVEGEKWLVAQLEEVLTDAAETVREIASEVPEDELDAKLDQLQELLDRGVWEVAACAVEQLQQRQADLLEAVHQLRLDLATYRLSFDDMQGAVVAADTAGAPVSTEDRELANALSAIQAAAEDANAGRISAAAAAVVQARQLLANQDLAPDGDATALQERIDALKEAAAQQRQEDQRNNRKTELFLISMPGGDPTAGSAVEYRVLLRRPSFESEQESNLHTPVQLRPEDLADFRGMADAIAAAAVRGVRASIERPEPAPEAGTRHIVLPTPASTTPGEEGPAERLIRVGRLMYSLLITDAMQRLIAESDCALTITSNDLELPWELMHDGENFLCVKRPLARMPIGAVFPRRTRPARIRPSAPWRVLLIHSDPDHDDPNRRLAAAEREVQAIFEKLRELVPNGNVDIIGPAEATVDTITRRLGSGEYDIIHYAGHAGFDARDPSRSHLLVHGRREFSADRIQKVLEGRPVVFLNACDTSRTGNADDTVGDAGIVARAQGLASAFVYGGAHACVGSLWPVFDDTARDLAVTFYDRLLRRRERVGEALVHARQQSRATNLDRLTWAAYALYGDPLHRLRDAPGVGG